MSSDTDYGKIGILCRDCGFLPNLISGYRSVEVRLDHVHQRKGNQEYASALVQILRGWHGNHIDDVVIVGDGEGDVRFCINLDNLPGHSLAPKRVRGLFIRHPPLERCTGGNENITLYESWEDLSGALAALLKSLRLADGTSSRTVVFVDVDRTVLFPRTKADGSYFAVRLEGLIDYV